MAHLKGCKNVEIVNKFLYVQIEFVKQAKLFGVYIDKTLSWDANIHFISKKNLGNLVC